MRFAFLAASAAACALSVPASAATWVFDVTATYNVSGGQTTKICEGISPSCYPTTAFPGLITETFRVSIDSTPGTRSYFVGPSSFAGYTFTRAFPEIGVMVANRQVTFLSASYQGDTLRSGCSTSAPVGCFSNSIDAYATQPNIRAQFVSSSDATAPVPEPATWAMMIGGFGLMGASMRIRRKTPATA